MYKKMLVISGPDGAGKTTVANRIRSIYQCSYFWIRGSHLFASLIGKLLKMTQYAKIKTPLYNPYYKIYLTPRMATPWIVIEIISFIPRIIPRYILRFLTCIISDRGFLDFLIWIILVLNNPKILTTPIGKTLTLLAIKEKPIILIGSEETLLKRSDIEDYLVKKQIIIYSILGKYTGKQIFIDGCTPEKIVTKILEIKGW